MWWKMAGKDKKKANNKGSEKSSPTKSVEEDEEYQKVISTYYNGEEVVRSLIALKVDTKMADEISTEVSKFPAVSDIYMVTGDVDIIMKTKFDTYPDLRQFIVTEIGKIKGVKDTRTMMIVTTYKENGDVKA